MVFPDCRRSFTPSMGRFPRTVDQTRITRIASAGGRDAPPNEVPCGVSKQIQLAFRRCGGSNRVRIGPFDHQIADVVRHSEQFERADAATEAGPPALTTAQSLHHHAVGRRLEALRKFGGGDLASATTLFADPANESLGQNPLHAGSDQERLDSHVEQPGRRPGGVVGVERREDEMAGQGRLHRGLGGLEVADLADHDDVGVVPQNRSEPRREGHARVALFTWIWFTPSTWYSTGSSTVIAFTASLTILFRDA